MVEAIAKPRDISNDAKSTHVAVLPTRSVWRVRSWCTSKNWSATLASWQSATWPMEVGTAIGDATRVLCIGRLDWLVVCDSRVAEEQMSCLAPSVEGCLVAIADLSAGTASVKISGCNAREVLSVLCGLDLHPSSFRVGQCTRTRLAQLPVTIDCLSELSFDCYFSQSFEKYFLLSIEEVLAGFGYPTRSK
jgi:heterotetrameric sarcosine oxidase gamma subunit